MKVLLTQNMDRNINKESSRMAEETFVLLMEKKVKWYMVYTL